MSNYDITPLAHWSCQAFWLRAAHRWLLSALALLTLIGPLWANLLVWPIEYLGYDLDPRSGKVIFVGSDSVAANAGMLVGDRVLSIYSVPIAALPEHWNRWQLIATSGAQIPVVVERAGTTLTFLLPRQAPSLRHQIAKIVFALLAAACWIAGALLGLGRRHEVNGSSLVAAFWLTLAGVLGSYVFAVDLSTPLLAVLLWLMMTLLPSLCIGLHVWFPARAVSRRRSLVARLTIVGTLLGSNALLAAAWLHWRPSLLDLIVQSWIPLVGAFTISFVGAGLLLFEAYRRTAVPHIRRQIRLVTAACLLTAAVWCLFRVLPLLIGAVSPLPDALIDLVPITIPLAYLVSGTATSLYSLDRMVRRFLADLLALTLIAVILGTVAVLAAPARSAGMLWLVLGTAVLVYPLVDWTRRLRARLSGPERSYAPLREARHQLTTSLDATTLVTAVEDGVRQTFTDPPFALYLAAPTTPLRLALVSQERLPELPRTLTLGTLTTYLLNGEPIVEARDLHTALRAMPLTSDEEVAIYQQGIALWCVIRRERSDMLALALIGTDGTLEPYRTEDRHEILELLDAASLAFAHSTAYEQLREAEARIRELFHAMRRVQDETETNLVHEIHDKIINEYVQTNIESAQLLLHRASNSELRAELELLLDGEYRLNKALRTICERLHPLALDEQWGLPSVLHAQVERVRARRRTSCSLEVSGTAVPVAPATTREIYRIVREALANAMKHAAATAITLRLEYPETPDGTLLVSITDNGLTGITVEPRAGHRGVLNMMESAKAADGKITFELLPEGGTRVAVRFRGETSLVRERPVEELVRLLAEHA
jgi:signal transduction histidine kinase